MKILYKQTAESSGLFSHIGVEQCYFKHLSVDRDSLRISRREHHHNGFEIHIIENGHQTYFLDGELCTVERGGFLLIPPGVCHRVVESDPCTSKFSITFNGYGNCDSVKKHALGTLGERIKENISQIVSEWEKHLCSSEILVSCCVLETVAWLLRASGMKESAERNKDSDSDVRFLFAKQYIDDNVERSLKVSEVADYCYLSEKQLTRIFAAEGLTPAEYIRHQRLKRIEELLVETDLTLKAISEKMNFSSEYYLNAFFKKHAGMTPGEYRRMNP